jgi:hypothetical protein
MTTWYYVNRFVDSIEPREVIKQTAKQFVWKASWGERRAMNDGYWFPTRAEAVSALREKLVKRVSGLQWQLSKAADNLRIFNAREPL